MNDDNFMDLLRVNAALALVSELIETLGTSQPVRLGQIASLTWLCHDKLNIIMTEIETRLEEAD